MIARTGPPGKVRPPGAGSGGRRDEDAAGGSSASTLLRPPVTTAEAALSEQDARRVTSEIQSELDSMQWSVHKIRRLIEKARDGAAHLALGYRSWTEYVAAEFSDPAGGPATKLTRDDRKKLVVQLSAMGMSTRAIGSVVGVDNSTVHRDLSGVADATPDDHEHLADSPIATATEGEFEAAIEQAKVEGDLSRENVESKLDATRAIVGRDGKAYTAPARPVRRRRPLPDVARDIGHDLEKLADKIERLLADDRLDQNVEMVGFHLRRGFSRIAVVHQAALARIEDVGGGGDG